MIVKRNYETPTGNEQRYFANKIFKIRNDNSHIQLINDIVGRSCDDQIVREYHVEDTTAYISSNPEFPTVQLIGREENHANAISILESITGLKLEEVKVREPVGAK